MPARKKTKTIRGSGQRIPAPPRAQEPMQMEMASPSQTPYIAQTPFEAAAHTNVEWAERLSKQARRVRMMQRKMSQIDPLTHEAMEIAASLPAEVGAYLHCYDAYNRFVGRLLTEEA